RHDLRAASLELDDAVVDRLVRVERRARRVDAGIEVFGTGFGAEHQGLGTGAGGGREGQHGHRDVLALGHELHWELLLWMGTPSQAGRAALSATRSSGKPRANQSSAKWHATRRWSTSRSGGRSARHKSTAYGQRVE